MTNDPLAIYLRDHHAAGSAGSALARRAAGNAMLPAERRAELTEVAREVADDLDTLESMMTSLGITSSAVKDRIGLVAELVGRLKLNGSLVSPSPLSPVIELEGLLAGIGAKAAMWRALALLAESGRALDAEELRRLGDRADRQREVVEACRLDAVARAFAAASPAAQPQAAAS